MVKTDPFLLYVYLLGLGLDFFFFLSVIFEARTRCFIAWRIGALVINLNPLELQAPFFHFSFPFGSGTFSGMGGGIYSFFSFCLDTLHPTYTARVSSQVHHDLRDAN
jgi:hypothetical protein